MLRSLGFATLAALLPTSLSGSSSSFIDYSNYCVGGSFVTCASVQVSATRTASGGTVLDILVRNLEGTHPNATRGLNILWFMTFGSATPVGYDWLPLLSSAHPGNPGVSYGTIGRVNGLPDPIDGGWEGGCDVDFPTVCYPDQYQFWPHIQGCTSDPTYNLNDPDGFGGFQTCPALGFTGWVVLRTTLDVAVNASDIFVAWHGSDGVNYSFCSLAAPSSPFHHVYSPDCNSTPYSSVPEPSTWALMATGLLLIGVGRGYRRRR